MSGPKPNVGAPFERLSLQTVDGGPPIEIGTPKDRWTMLFVYRGSHCPRCKRFLGKLNEALPAWQKVMDVVVVSADTREKAKADRDAFGWKFDLCHGLTVPQLRAIGLYVSEP
jgi:peroxiredoxin